MSFNSLPLDLNNFLSFMCLLDFCGCLIRGCKVSIKIIDQQSPISYLMDIMGGNVLSILASIWCQRKFLEAFHPYEKTLLLWMTIKHGITTYCFLDSPWAPM
jgi:hypothetical protein